MQTKQRIGRKEQRMNWIKRNSWNLIIFLAGAALTLWGVQYTLASRGYFAVGGEWLPLPFLLLIKWTLSADWRI